MLFAAYLSQFSFRELHLFYQMGQGYIPRNFSVSLSTALTQGQLFYSDVSIVLVVVVTVRLIKTFFNYNISITNYMTCTDHGKRGSPPGCGFPTFHFNRNQPAEILIL